MKSKTMTTLTPSNHHEKGISLIESLVALLVLALGILGMAGLQTRTLIESRSTNSRSIAIDMTDDLSERIQFNSGARLAPVNPYLVNFGAAGATPNCFNASCTPAQTAQLDIAQWKNTIAALLPGGDAAVFQLPNDNTQLGVLISWNDNIANEADDANDGGAYRAPLTVNVPAAGLNCPPTKICHLAYIRP